MKSIFKIAILVALFLDLSAAKNNAPQGMADVLGRAINTESGSSWYAKFGHVAMYNSSTSTVLEVTNQVPAVRQVATSTMTNNAYWGARYGAGSASQRYKVVSAGYAQKYYRPRYTFSPYYVEGKWTSKWRYSWSKGWYKKWTKQSAKFRCDAFVNYCYKKATKKRLIKHTWQTMPEKVFKALPYKR